MTEKQRCVWPGTDPLYLAYHDNEWGVPLHDDRALFELLILEGAQAGLSWLTVLKKREAYRQAFDFFDAERIALYGDLKTAELLQNPGIIRNRLKIAATIKNAQALLALKSEFSTFDAYLWRFVNGKPIQTNRRAHNELPARSPESDALSKDLLSRGFKFVGSTICYAFLQASGMVNDHVITCFRHRQLRQVVHRGDNA
jgi:DNA-3-methyladenine glycosylase I